MTMKKKGNKQAKEEKIAVEFMKSAIEARKQMGAKIVGIRKA